MINCNQKFDIINPTRVEPYDFGKLSAVQLN